VRRSPPGRAVAAAQKRAEAASSDRGDELDVVIATSTYLTYDVF
jgi:hypothetical protein